MNPDVVIGIAIPLSFMLTVIGFLIYLYKSRVKKLDALVKIVELGGNVDPDMMKMLSTDTVKSHKTDYRTGLIWLAIGVPFTLALLLSEGLTGGLIASIFVFVGVAYLISGKYRWREEDS